MHYELRSKVTHGYSLFICSERDYQTMLWAAKEIFAQFLKLVKKYHPKSIVELIRILEDNDKMIRFIGWLDEYNKQYKNSYSEKIKKALEKACSKKP